MTDLLTHIKAKNATTQVWIDGGEDRWAGMIVEDLAHWAEYDIHTVEQYEQYMMATTLSELYKDVNGVRPNFNVEDMTPVEIARIYDMLLVDLRESNMMEQINNARSIQEFEDDIVATISSGADDRETAIRWLRDAEDDDLYKNDDGYFEYSNGLPYGYLKAEVQI